ncbi:peptide ABC transporter substrate-binding protein [Euryhalocaulis caribicus]|uniref:peptide ABC transporter substrate-binding protein n=1 Tax=Euryhalocaulis caribicus TaxID=1161401 RepID=UPI0003AA7225|nr:peptide ABC transporter substrate-binding protein [Euryhalocaulis caribicus]
MNRNAFGLAMAAGALFLAACGGGEDTGETLAQQAADKRILHRGNTAEPLSLDPHKAAGKWEDAIIGDMFVGLYTDNAQAEPIYGMAENHTVSSDGKTWTFTLRDAQWSDGTPVTANDFEFAFRRIMDPSTLSQYASLLYVIKNAQPVNEGAMDPEQLGVTAVDEKTLRIELEYPAPYLPGLLTHHTAFPVPRHVIDEYGAAWIQPGNVVVNGPFKLTEWRTNDYVHVAKNETFYDADNVCLNEIYYYPTNDNNAAVRRLRAGELHINSEFPGQKIEELREQLPGYVRVSPFLATVYYVYNVQRPPFDDARVRQALAMALGREFMVDEILKTGQLPAPGLVPPGIANYGDGAKVDWWDMSMDERKARARELLEEAGYGPENPLRFEYTHRNTSDNPRVAPVVQADWEDIAEWVDVEITGVETQIHYDNLRAGNFDVGDAAWASDFNDPINFLYLLETKTGQMNYGKYSNPRYDALIEESNRTLDMEQRAQLLHEAEQIMLDDMPIIPMWYFVTKNLVSPEVTGWEDNVVDIHRSRYLCFEDAAPAGAGAVSEAEADAAGG